MTKNHFFAQVCFDNKHNWLYHEIGEAMDTLESLRYNSKIKEKLEEFEFADYNRNVKRVDEEEEETEGEKICDDWSFTEDFGIRQLSQHLYF